MSKLVGAAMATVLLLPATAQAQKSGKISPKVGRLMAQELSKARALARRFRPWRKKSSARTPPPLRGLRDNFAAAVDSLMQELQAGHITAADWSDEFGALLARYHQAGYMLGAGTLDLDDKSYTWVGQFIDSQLDYLSGFQVVLQDAEEWTTGFDARAEMYADAIKVPYWKGDTQMLPLPAMPAEGTQCLNNCGCKWRVEAIDVDAGDYDAYWERSKDDSCQTCLTREAEWSPVRIRGGELQA